MRYVELVFESFLTDALMRKAKVALMTSLRGGGISTVRQFVRMEAGGDPFGPDPEDFDELIDDWCENALHDASWKITRLIANGQIRAWREITADADWSPDKWTHPGIYWSWDAHAAEAHWGGQDHEGAGPVTWLMEALLDIHQIDWPITLAMNADPDYEEERELRILPGSPVHITSYQKR